MLTTVHSLIMSNVVIHCKPSLLETIMELGHDWCYSTQHGNNEIDVIVPDVEYIDGNHPSKNGIWEDPDMQLCDYYGIDYDLVNCIEAM